MSTYEKPEENEWIQPVRKDYRLACCDCGLVHNVDFRIFGKKIQFRVRRNNRATAAIRRWLSTWIVSRVEVNDIDQSESEMENDYNTFMSDNAKANDSAFYKRFDGEWRDTQGKK